MSSKIVNSYKIPNSFKEKDIEGKNTIIQKAFNQLMKCLGNERKYVPELIRNDKGEIGIKMTIFGRDAGSFFPSTGSVKGERIPNRKGSYDTFKFTKNIAWAFDVVERLCFKERFSSEISSQMASTEYNLRYNLEQKYNELQQKYEKLKEDRDLWRQGCEVWEKDSKEWKISNDKWKQMYENLVDRLPPVQTGKQNDSYNSEQFMDNDRPNTESDLDLADEKDVLKEINNLIIDSGAVPPIK